MADSWEDEADGWETAADGMLSGAGAAGAGVAAATVTTTALAAVAGAGVGVSAGGVDSWEDEVDELDAEQQAAELARQRSYQEAARKKAEAQQREAVVAEQRLEARVASRIQEAETPEERLERERRAVEEADNDLTNELFGAAPARRESSGPRAQGLGAIPTATKKDHAAFAVLVGEKLRDSTPLNVSVFLQELLGHVGGRLTADQAAELSAAFNRIRQAARGEAAAADAAALERRRKEEEEAATGKKKKNKNKKKKEEQQRAAEIYGAAEADEYDDYADLEDDFM